MKATSWVWPTFRLKPCPAKPCPWQFKDVATQNMDLAYRSWMKFGISSKTQAGPCQGLCYQNCRPLTTMTLIWINIKGQFHCWCITFDFCGFHWCRQRRAPCMRASDLIFSRPFHLVDPGTSSGAFRYPPNDKKTNWQLSVQVLCQEHGSHSSHHLLSYLPNMPVSQEEMNWAMK